MNQSTINLTSPILSCGPMLCFSAYGFGWRYRAFSLGFGVVREELGAADETSRQLMLAFELGLRQIVEAVQRKEFSSAGERIPLAAGDLAPASVPDGTTSA